MNTNKIKIELNRSELQALLIMLNTYQEPADHNYNAIMSEFIIRKVFYRLMNRLQNQNSSSKKNIKISLKRAEAVALIIILDYVDPQIIDVYNSILIMNLKSLIDQKLA